MLFLTTAYSEFENADQIARALARGDISASAAYAECDPWITSTLLRLAGKRDLAMEVARTGRDESEALLEHLDSDWQKADALKVAGQIGSGLRLLRKDPAGALAVAGQIDLAADPVLAVCALKLKVEALDALDLPGESRAKIEAAKHAHAIGWRSRRNHLLQFLACKHLIESEVDWIDDGTFIRNRKRLKRGERLIVYGSLEDELVALVVSPHTVDFIPLGDATIAKELLSRSIRAPSDSGLLKAREVLVEPLGLGDAQFLEIIPQAALQFVPFGAISDRSVTLWPDLFGLVRNLKRDGATPSASIDVSGMRSIRGCRPVDLRKCIGQRARYRAVYVRLELEGRLLVHRDGKIHVQDFLKYCDTDLVAFGWEGSARHVHPGRPARSALAAVLAALDDKHTSKSKHKRLDREVEEQIENLQLGPQPLMSKRCPSILVNVWCGGPEAAEHFLNRFHAHWVKGEPAPTCLLKAQQEMRRSGQWSDPRYWAGWQVWGRR